jgi:hypothetical protein
MFTAEHICPVPSCRKQMDTKEEKSEHLLLHQTGTKGEAVVSAKGGIGVRRQALTKKRSSNTLEIRRFQKWSDDRKSPLGQRTAKNRSVIPPGEEGRRPVNWKRTFSFRSTWRAERK